jgi:hypothetical protein
MEAKGVNTTAKTRDYGTICNTSRSSSGGMPWMFSNHHESIIHSTCRDALRYAARDGLSRPCMGKAPNPRDRG